MCVCVWRGWGECFKNSQSGLFPPKGIALWYSSLSFCSQHSFGLSGNFKFIIFTFCSMFGSTNHLKIVMRLLHRVCDIQRVEWLLCIKTVIGWILQFNSCGPQMQSKQGCQRFSSAQKSATNAPFCFSPLEHVWSTCLEMA